MMQARILLLMAALVSADALVIFPPSPAPTPFPTVQACPAGQARTSHYVLEAEAGSCGEDNITTLQDCNSAFAALNSRGAFSSVARPLPPHLPANNAHLVSTSAWPGGCVFDRGSFYLYFNIDADEEGYRKYHVDHYEGLRLCTGCGAPTPAPPTLPPTPAPTPVPCPAGQVRQSWVLTTGMKQRRAGTGDGTCGNATITTAKECDAVAAALNVGQRTSLANQTTAVSYNERFRPHGCALIEGDRLYFNQNQDPYNRPNPCNSYNYKCLCSACGAPTPAPTPAPPTPNPTPFPTPASAPAWCPTGQVRKSWVLTAGTCGSATITTIDSCSAAAYALGYAASVQVNPFSFYPSGCLSLFGDTYFRHVGQVEGARQVNCGSDGAECICSACVTPDDPLILPLAASLATVFVVSAAILIRRIVRRRRAANENEDASDTSDGDLASRSVIISMVEKTATQATTSAAVL